MRWTRSCALVATTLIALLVLRVVVIPTRTTHFPVPLEENQQFQTYSVDATSTSIGGARPTSPASIHPIDYLHTSAREDFDTRLASQSTSLSDAVREYRRRYGMPPPPKFDIWYKFAKSKRTRLIDEFDTIYDSLLPFWALKPESIRNRVREALGYEPNGLITLQIRNGDIARLEGGPEWQLTELKNMLQSFVRYLPDLNLAFNVHDEPRVVIPHDQLTKMVSSAKSTVMAAASSNTKLENAFSSRPDDMDDARRRIPVPLSSRFNEYQHQPVWVPSRISCSVDSPARDFEDDTRDDTASYSMGELGFVFNQTAFSDICSTPSLRDSYGFFQRPNAFKVAHELIPVFSQSKLSSFQDILYPSPWYHYGKIVTDLPVETHKVQYDESCDPDWDEKNSTFWWRGSTTGGFSREGGWRHQHRQTFVARINAKDDAQILTKHGTVAQPRWHPEEVPRQKYSDCIDIHFSGIGQCDPGDCDAQWEFFDVAKPVDSQKAWRHRLLLDMDGNAFSGRFYSFLRSKSLPLKVSLFREWHQDWLAPWLHYAPLSLQGDEHLEVVRYFTTDERGQAISSSMARDGRDWANTALRNDDMQVWFFRLLLEYARVVDDNRLSIGFTG